MFSRSVREKKKVPDGGGLTTRFGASALLLLGVFTLTSSIRFPRLLSCLLFTCVYYSGGFFLARSPKMFENISHAIHNKQAQVLCFLLNFATEVRNSISCFVSVSNTVFQKVYTYLPSIAKAFRFQMPFCHHFPLPFHLHLLSNTVFSLQFLQIPQGVQLRVVVVELTFFHYGRKEI